MSANLAEIVVAIGATGSGKSTWIKSLLPSADRPRLIAFDPLGEYSRALGIPQTSDWTIAARVCMALAQDPKREIRLAYVPPLWDHKKRRAQFGRLCRLVHAAGNMALIVEEAHLVCEPGQGNEQNWTTLVATARHRKVSVFVSAQRPAMLDKTTIDNLTALRVFKIASAPSRKYLAEILGTKPEVIGAIQKLEFIEYNSNTGELTPGKLQFSDATSPRIPGARGPGGRGGARLAREKPSA